MESRCTRRWQCSGDPNTLAGHECKGLISHTPPRGMKTNKETPHATAEGVARPRPVET